MKKLKSLKTIPYFLPLIVFIATIIYGLLKIDKSIGPEKEAYGWNYLAIMFPITIIYLIAFFFMLNKSITLMKMKKSQQGDAQGIIIGFIISFVFSVLFVCVGYFYILMPTNFYTKPAVVGFGVNVFLLAIFGYQTNKKVTDTYFTENENTTEVNVKRKVLISVIPVIATICTAGVMFTYQTLAANSLKNQSEKILTQKYKGIGTTADIQIVKQYISENKKRISVVYSLKEGKYKLYAKATMKADGKNSVLESTDTTFTRPSNSLMTVFRIQADSHEGQAILDNYQSAVKTAIKKSNISSENLLVKTADEQISIYDKPHFSYRPDRKSKKIDEKAKVNVQSNDKNKKAFAGYASIPIKDLMVEHLVFATVVLEVNYKLSEKEQDAVEEKLPTIIKNLDVKKLPDGYYEVEIFNGNAQMFAVKKHKIINAEKVIREQPLESIKEKETSHLDNVKW